MPKVKFYAVRRGRQGAKIYSTWDECRVNVDRFYGASHKSFVLYEDAVMWINSGVTALPANTRVAHQGQSHVVDLTIDDDYGVADAVKDLDDEVRGGFGIHSMPIDLTNSDNEFDSKHAGPSNQAHKKRKPAPKTTDNNPMEEKTTTTPLAGTIVLSPEQKAVLDRVNDDQSVFFTGSAGTGKSVLLREIIRVKGGGPSNTLGITASTGIASVNIGGTTLHSWAGIGLGKEPAKQLANKVIFHKGLEKVRKRWRTTRTLIIDEISMIDGALFQKLEEVARIIREDQRPFGGIQLILCGDFCQLPPVPERVDGVQIPAIFAFDAQCWHTCVGEPVFLTRVFRQKDQTFVDMLNDMRLGKITSKTEQIFKGLSREIEYTDGIEPTELFALRNEVDRSNQYRLDNLTGDIHRYLSTDVAGVDSKGQPVPLPKAIKLLDRLVVPKEVNLRIGAQVMLVKNLVQGRLVNGSVGKVIAFSTPKEAEDSPSKIIISDDPLSEGGRPHHPNSSIGRTQWPVVKFLNGMDILCVPQEFTVNNASGEGMEASRSQIPLILAWSLSVHKSQGQTLERVKVNLRSTFEKGQAYVALSRATKLETLQVLNFDASKVMAHPRVLEWMGEDDMDTEGAMASYYD